jgi:putative ABC transport system permease protein
MPHSGPQHPPPAAPPAPGLALVRLVAPLVPHHRRAEWLAEWEGELHWSAREALRRGDTPTLAHLRNHWRALGATADALWLRRRHGAAPMLDLDLKYALRSLRRRPGFAAVVVLTLALGIGATTAVFSVVYGVLLRPLPLPAPEQLVRVEGYPLDGNREKIGTGHSYPDFADIRAQATSFRHLAALREATATLTAPDAEPERVPTARVTGDFFAATGVGPVLGRGFTVAEGQPGAPPVAVIGHGLWQQRWGGSPDVIGQRLTLDGVTGTIVGVMPPEVGISTETRVWLPLVPGPLEEVRGVHQLGVIGRLKPGVTVADAATELRTIAARLERQYPQDNTNRGVRALPLRDAMVADARATLWVLLGAVALVLLIGCTNLASLFLARAAAREREMAVRAALGAGQGRLVRQWMAESLLLSLAGGLAGLLVAWVGMRALLAWAPRTVPRASEIALDLPVLGFLLGVSVLAGLLFGALPAVQQRRAPFGIGALRDGARGTTAGRERRRLRQGLVVAEIALATVLVVGAGLLVKSVWTLQHSELPLRPDGMLVARLQLPPARYDSVGRVLQFYARLRDEVAALPGVQAVSVAYEHPLSPGWTSSYTIAGRERPAPGTEPEARVRPVSPGYFRTVGLPLRRGRDVAATDGLTAPGVVVVNEAFVRRHFASQDPIGQRLEIGGGWWPGQPTSFTIVGVVADEPFLGVATPAEPATYYPHAQFPMNEMWLVVRAAGDPAALVPALRERIWRVDADLPVETVRSLRELLGATAAEPRFNAVLLALFAAAALLLAAIGIYGVLSYTVAQRTGEIGVRMALGAARGRVVRQVVGQGMLVALLGVALGVAGSLGLVRLLASLLVGVSAHDPLVFAAVPLLLALTALAAAWLPARRASLIEPAVALRGE